MLKSKAIPCFLKGLKFLRKKQKQFREEFWKYCS